MEEDAEELPLEVLVDEEEPLLVSGEALQLPGNWQRVPGEGCGKRTENDGLRKVLPCFIIQFYQYGLILEMNTLDAP